MRAYSIFEIKKEYQPFIFGREHLLYELLTESEQHSQSTNARNEVSYLCEPIDSSIIEHAIMHKMSNVFPTIDKEEGFYHLSHPIKGEIQIVTNTFHMEVKCDGSRMLDLDLFVSLSNVSESYFALLADEMECGWLKPVKMDESNYMTIGKVDGNSSLS